MAPSTTRPLGPARIVALALVALAAAGLAYLRFAPDAGRASVPAGARAGQLALSPCTVATEDGRYPADCGTLVVPENRHDAGSRLIALPVTRIHARSTHPAEPVFRLQGGPGLTNMTFGEASRFAGDRDVVLVGYRGVDGSVRLDCPEVDSAMKHARDLLGPAYFADAERAYRTCASRLQADGVDLRGYSLPERVDDLEAARRALGYGKVELLSESAGTRTALIYAWRHPSSIARSVMIGVNPPGNFLWYPRTTDEQIRRYAALCAEDGSCRGRTDDLAATIRATNARMPGHWWFLPVKKGNVRLGSFFGLVDATSAASPISAPQTIDAWLAAARGDASGLWLVSTLSQLVFPSTQVKGDLAAVARSDAAYARRFYAGDARRGSILGDPGTDFLWAGGRLLDAWPAGPDDDAYGRLRVSRVPTLLVGGRLDLATPPQTATRELLPYLPNGHQVVLPAIGHTDDFWKYEPAAGSHLVNAFLASGTVDATRYGDRPVDFTPGFTQTAIAKILLGSMLGLGGLAAGSLLWLAWRVLARGRLGRRGSAIARTLVAPVVGAGGWTGGALLVLATMPTVSLDSELLAGLSVGVPVGLATSLAWIDRASTRGRNASGAAAAVAAGLVGAWLGVDATTGLVAVLTAILGAAAGANLVLLVLDVLRDRSARVPAAEPRRPSVAAQS